MAIRFKTGDLVHDTGLCEPQLNLLAHAQCIELDIGSVCGGHGVCGKDRIRISPEDRSVFSPLTENEREHLTPDEIASGMRLACQCFPNLPDAEITVLSP